MSTVRKVDIRITNGPGAPVPPSRNDRNGEEQGQGQEHRRSTITRGGCALSLLALVVSWILTALIVALVYIAITG